MTNQLRSPLRSSLRSPFEHRRGGWSPLALFSSGEQGVWYDPSDMSTLFQDSAGTTPVTAAGQPVGKMLDKSGRGYHLTQPSDALRPTLQDVGGLCLVFGGAHWMQSPVIDATSGSAYAVFASYTKTNTGTAVLVEFGPDSSETKGTLCVFINNIASPNDSPLIFGATQYELPIMASVKVGDKCVLSAAGDLYGANISERIDSRICATTTPPVTVFGGAPGGRNFTAQRVNIGARDGGTLPSSMRLYSLVLRFAATSSTDRAKMEDYAAAKIRRSIWHPLSPWAASGANIAALGDSTVDAYAGGTNLLALSGFSSTLIAVAGHTIAQQKTAWQAAHSKGAFNAVIIQIGLNDLDPAEASSVAIARIQDLVNTVLGDVSVPVIIATMIPCKQRLIGLYGAVNGLVSQQKWADMNSAISGAGPTPITGVSGRITGHTPLMADDDGNLFSLFNTGDNIHPNNAGRQINADHWRLKLIDLGVSL